MENVDVDKVERNMLTVDSVMAIIKNLFTDEQQNPCISIIDHSSFLLTIEVPFLASDKVPDSDIQK